jgi:hypothetical protein
MNSITSILDSAWTAIAALIGSGGALLVALTGIWNSRRQLRIQLEQQSREFKLGREMNLRRDVYLEAAGALARSTNSLTELADVSSESTALARQNATDFGIVAKVHVVGSEALIEALMKVTRELARAQTELSTARIPMLAQRQRLEAIAVGSEQWSQLDRECTMARLQLAELALDWSGRVAAHVPEAIAAIRKELDLPLHLERYREHFERGWRQNQEHLRSRIERFRAELQGKPAP